MLELIDKFLTPINYILYVMIFIASVSLFYTLPKTKDSKTLLNKITRILLLSITATVFFIYLYEFGLLKLLISLIVVMIFGITGSILSKKNINIKNVDLILGLLTFLTGYGLLISPNSVYIGAPGNISFLKLTAFLIVAINSGLLIGGQITAMLKTKNKIKNKSLGFPGQYLLHYTLIIFLINSCALMYFTESNIAFILTFLISFLFGFLLMLTPSSTNLDLYKDITKSMIHLNIFLIGFVLGNPIIATLGAFSFAFAYLNLQDNYQDRAIKNLLIKSFKTDS